MAPDQSYALPADIQEGQVIETPDTVADQSQQNALDNQQAMNQLGASLTEKVVNLLADTDPLEAEAAAKALTDNDVAEMIAD
jgi:hypothetical protein